MAIVPLPLPPGAEARVLLRRLLAHRDVVGRDSAGRTIIQLAVDDWVLDKLATFERAAAALEHAGGEPGHAPWPPHPDRGGHLRWRGHHLHDELDAVPVTDLEPSGFATGQAREPDVAAAPPAAGRPLGIASTPGPRRLAPIGRRLIIERQTWSRDSRDRPLAATVLMVLIGGMPSRPDP